MKLQPGFMSPKCERYDIDKISLLLFDHDQMVKRCIENIAIPIILSTDRRKAVAQKIYFD